MSVKLTLSIIQKKNILKVILFLFTGIPFNSVGQWNSGTITYERKMNSEFLMEEMRSLNGIKDEAYQSYISSQPKFKSSIFTLKFKGDSSFYYPSESKQVTPASNDEWFVMCGYNNRVQKNTKKRIAQWEKEVFASKFLISDTLRHIKWKITDETREIAGFECRRANALIMDSIYVVAFYTTDIQSSDGPESIYGLPGMILGAVLPYEHITWFAVNVNTETVDTLIEGANSKQPKSLSNLSYKSKIEELTASWGNIKNLIKKKALF
ncbi:GLPGLI family protein [Pedobacter sp. MR2016-19]|uniref:GLPGLI family protein n=1 Tax=Pedobacter sp. MR2016-19 TaxID=2780089 RepID=UPI0018762FF7|nr:GLPGLI family protein [Pedobacter sp. MR2016-19]MBE5317740.1 GLPGLI family protein [Pedobacter sp. MR2016-19]